MRILGIDPGYERLGLAVIDRGPNAPETLVFSTCLRTPTKQIFAERLLTLGEELSKLIEKYKPEHLSLEQVFIAANRKTATRVAEVRGVIIYLAAKNNLPVIDLTPLQVKMAITGFGRASKEQIQVMASKLLRLGPSKKLDDEYDAMAIALAGLGYCRQIYPHLSERVVAK